MAGEELNTHIKMLIRVESRAVVRTDCEGQGGLWVCLYVSSSLKMRALRRPASLPRHEGMWLWNWGQPSATERLFSLSRNGDSGA